MRKIICNVLSKHTVCIDRIEYWFMFALGLCIWIFIECMTFVIWQTWFANYINAALIILGIEAVLFRIYGCYIGIKRFHDAGKSTGFFWICFVLQFLVIGIVITLVVLCSKSVELN